MLEFACQTLKHFLLQVLLILKTMHTASFSCSLCLCTRVPVPGFIMYSPLQSMRGAWFLNAIRSSGTMHAARFAVISVTSKAREKEAARRWQHKEGGKRLFEQNENPLSTESTQRGTELHDAAESKKKKEFGQWTIGAHRHKCWTLAMFRRFSTAAPQHWCYLK